VGRGRTGFVGTDLGTEVGRFTFEKCGDGVNVHGRLGEGVGPL